MTGHHRASGLAAFAACFLLFGCTTTVAGQRSHAGPATSDATSSSSTATPCSADAFVLTPPPSWDDITETSPAALVAYADVTDPSGFAPNVNVVCEPAAGFDAQGYADANRTLEEDLLNATIEDEHDTALDGEPTIRWRLQHDKASPVLLELVRVLVVHGGSGWVISLTTTAEDVDLAAEYMD